MRLIDADALKKKAQMRGHVLEKSMVTAYHMCVSTHDIDEAPTVDAEPVRHAKVVTVTGRHHMMHQECSYCGGELGWKEYPIYCPNCGAELDEEVE